MRRTLGVLLMVLAMTGLCQAGIILEDFDSYAIENINGTAGWESPGTQHAVISMPLGEVSNQALQVAATTGTQGLLKNITGTFPNGIPNDATGKFSFSYRFWVPTNTTPNVSIGLSMLSTNTIGTDYNSFRVQTRISRNGDTVGSALRLDFRNAGAFSYANAGQAVDIVTDTWYQVWVDVDNSTDKYEVYVQGGAQTEKTKLTPEGGASFRLAAAGPLNSIITLGNTIPLYLDDILLSNAIKETREVAHNPTPAKLTIGLPSTGVSLSFSGGENPAVPGQVNPMVHSRYLYLTDGEPNQVVWTGVPAIKLTDTTDPFAYGPVSLEMDKIYYWYIKEVVTPGQGATDPNALVGPVWRFETLKSFPILKTNPQDTRVFAGETAQFQVQFDSLSTPTAVWKKYVDGVNDTTVTGGAPVFDSELGQYVSTLTVANVTLASFGQYYCVVNNSSNQPQTTGMAWLGIKRVLAYYPFDGNAEDAAGDNNGTLGVVETMNPLPGFVPGYKAGSQAVMLDGALQQYVSIPVTAYPKTGYDNGLPTGSISGWVKIANTGAIISNANNDATHFSVDIQGNSNVRVIVRDTAGAAPSVQGRPASETNMINDGKWHFFTGTWEQGGKMAMYVDGIQVAITDVVAPRTFLDWEYPILIGAGRTAGNRPLLTSFFTGAIDNLKIYNYYQTREEVAQIWFDETGKNVCFTDTYANAYDYNKDCVVDLNDFGVFASQWLNCGLYPVCE